jgi:hypothetical protein
MLLKQRLYLSTGPSTLNPQEVLWVLASQVAMDFLWGVLDLLTIFNVPNLAVVVNIWFISDIIV